MRAAVTDPLECFRADWDKDGRIYANEDTKVWWVIQKLSGMHCVRVKKKAPIIDISSGSSSSLSSSSSSSSTSSPSSTDSDKTQEEEQDQPAVSTSGQEETFGRRRTDGH
jgi:hypothetical protein